MSTAGGTSGDSNTGGLLIARADFSQVGSGDASKGGDSLSGGDGTPRNFIAGDDMGEGGSKDASRAGGDSQSGSIGHKNFPWLWVFGLIAAVGVPLLFLVRVIRRIEKEKSSRETNRLDDRQKKRQGHQ
jgi:hypothetical protein